MPETVREKTRSQVAFGDIVRLSNVKSKNPESDGFDRYVGLEHLEPSDLKIRSWGDISDGTTFTNVFTYGQVLFGKRRAYQRKVAVADFSGVCSGDIYVFEPKDSNLLTELLPFICQSESFFNYVISMSQGGLSPRVNWKAIAKYEFALPPLEEQRRIAEVLQAARNQADCLADVYTSASRLYASTSSHLFSQETGAGIRPNDWKPDSWQCVPLEQLVVPDAPICYGIVQVGEDVPNGIPTLAIHNLDGDFRNGVHRTSLSIEANYGRSRVAPDDILVSIKGTIGEIAIVPSYFQGNISRDLARLRVKELEVRGRFLYHLFRTPRFRRYINSLIVGTTRAELSIALLRTMEVPLPPLKVQDQISAQLDLIIEAQFALADRLESVRKLLSNGLNQLLGRVFHE